MYNRLHFWELLHGAPYGRKIAYTDVQAIDETNIVKVLAETIGVHNYNKTFIKYLWDYKNGDQPIRYRTKTIRDDVKNVVTENRAWEIVRFKNAQTFGEPVQIVSLSKDDDKNASVDRLNTMITKANKQVADVDSGEWVSAVGFGYEAVLLKHGQRVPLKYISCDPMNTYIVYSRNTKEPLMSVQELKDDNNKQYYLCFTDTYEYRIQGGQLLTLETLADGTEMKKRLHIFGGIPIVEKPNNQSRVSDIELVIDILDAINNLASNRMDGVEQFVQSFFKFVNCDIDEDTFQKMKMLGAITVKSNNGSENKADVDIISQELNQSETQVYKEDLWDSALSIEAIPGKQNGSDGGSTQGAVSLRGGWDHAKQAAKVKDAYVESAEMELSKIALNILQTEFGFTDYNIDELDYKVQITHSPQDNLYTKVEALNLLLSSGIHPLVAISTCGLWGDAEKVYINSKPYLDAIYKTIDEQIKELGLQNQVTQAQEILSNNNA